MADKLDRNILKTLALASLGSMLEFYDFLVYSFLAPALSEAFFPPDMPVWIKDVQVFAIFALGYLLRPIAGTVIGHYSDRVGRKKLFMLTIIAMAASTFAIAILPTYEMIGWFAPLLLLTCRLVQGCAVAGEVAGASVFVMEHAPRGRVGLCGATLQSAINLAFFLGTGASLLSNAIAAKDPALHSLAWRLPFLSGGVFGLFAIYVRRFLHESPLFLKMKASRREAIRLPIKIVLTKYFPACVLVLGLTLVNSQTSSVFFQYLPSFLSQQHHVSRDSILYSSMFATLAFALVMPLWGWYSDAVGFGKAIGTAAVIDICAVLFFFLNVPFTGVGLNNLTFAWILLGLGASWSCLINPIAASLFPTEVRFSGVASSYNTGIALFVGTSPLLMTGLVRQFGATAPMYTTLVGAGVLLVSSFGVSRARLYLGSRADVQNYGFSDRSAPVLFPKESAK